MLGIEAVAYKGNWIILMGCSVLLIAGAILIAKIIKVWTTGTATTKRHIQ